MLDENHTEIWKPVLGFETDYSVSNFGKVRRDTATRTHSGGKLLSLIIDSAGYARVNISVNGIRITRKVHRLVLEAFAGCCPGKQINHKNGIKTDNRISNLEWVTASENILHAFRELGREPSRTDWSKHTHPRQKVTDDDVRKIRNLALSVPIAIIANQFGIGKKHASRIARNVCRKNIA